MKKFLPILPIVLLILAFSHASASNVQIQRSTLYPFQSTLEIQDDFLFGINTSGNIGYGWGFANGTVTWISSETNRPGIIRRDTTAAAGTLARTDLQIVAASLIDPVANHRVVHVMRLNNNDADTMVRAGAYNATFSNPPANGIYVEKLFADTNWFCITRSGGVQTRVDSGVAVDTNFHTFAYTRDSSGVQFTIDSANVCGVMTTNITTTFLDPATQLLNNVGVSKTLDMDYFQLTMSGISR